MGRCTGEGSMVAKQFIPERGDIAWLSFNPVRGHEQSGMRPAVVVSTKGYNAKSGLALVCPITSQAKGYPFEIPISTADVEGVILADQVRSIDWNERRLQRIGSLPPAPLADLQEYLRRMVFE